MPHVLLIIDRVYLTTFMCSLPIVDFRLEH